MENNRHLVAAHNEYLVYGESVILHTLGTRCELLQGVWYSPYTRYSLLAATRCLLFSIHKVLAVSCYKVSGILLVYGEYQTPCSSSQRVPSVWRIPDTL
jgi:hypothetical protein